MSKYVHAFWFNEAEMYQCASSFLASSFDICFKMVIWLLLFKEKMFSLSLSHGVEMFHLNS